MLRPSQLLPTACTDSPHPVYTAVDQQFSLSQYYKNLYHREQTPTIQRIIDPPHSETETNKDTDKYGMRAKCRASECYTENI